MTDIDREELVSTVQGIIALPFVLLLCVIILAGCSGYEETLTGTAQRVYEWTDGTETQTSGSTSVRVSGWRLELYRGCLVPFVGNTVLSAVCETTRRTDRFDGGTIYFNDNGATVTLSGTAIVDGREGSFLYRFTGQR